MVNVNRLACALAIASFTSAQSLGGPAPTAPPRGVAPYVRLPGSLLSSH